MKPAVLIAVFAICLTQFSCRTRTQPPVDQNGELQGSMRQPKIPTINQKNDRYSDTKKTLQEEKLVAEQTMAELQDRIDDLQNQIAETGEDQELAEELDSLLKTQQEMEEELDQLKEKIDQIEKEQDELQEKVTEAEKKIDEFENNPEAQEEPMVFSNMSLFYENDCLDIFEASFDDGASARVYPCTGEITQRFTITYVDAVFFTIRSVYSGKCLYRDQGNNLVQRSCFEPNSVGSENEQFYFYDVEGFEFKVRNRGTSRCFKIANDGNVYLGGCEFDYTYFSWR